MSGCTGVCARAVASCRKSYWKCAGARAEYHVRFLKENRDILLGEKTKVPNLWRDIGDEARIVGVEALRRKRVRHKGRVSAGAFK